VEEEGHSSSNNLSDEFFEENAVGYNTMRKTYIDGKEDVIQYAFKTDKS
jgi:hypothetical protein